MVVTFKQGEKPTPINSLSGGQKTICALALIFAIQKCDRAPFYLFDEIDANLDSAKRKNLAEVIREFSKAEQVNENESIQYIIATFHKEIVEKSHKAFHITNDGTSHIVPIPIREAELIILQETKKTIAQQAPTSKGEEEDVVEQNKENLTTHNVEERPSKSTDVSDSEGSQGKKQTKKKQPKKKRFKTKKNQQMMNTKVRIHQLHQKNKKNHRIQKFNYQIMIHNLDLNNIKKLSIVVFIK